MPIHGVNSCTCVVHVCSFDSILYIHSTVEPCTVHFIYILCSVGCSVYLCVSAFIINVCTHTNANEHIIIVVHLNA